jgi:general secretion pathway protein A
MYEQFYGLREKPFSILPDPDLIYWGETHRLAFAMLEFGVMNSAGFTVISGEIGAGKTTLIRHLLRKLDRNLTVGLLSNTRLGREDLLRWIMMALGQPFENASYLSLYQKFEEFLKEEYAKRRHVVLIIDEAQGLGAAALEELRMLSNINADKDQLLQLILVGQPQLRSLLQTPELTQFAQRVSSDFHLMPLRPEEVTEYVGYRIRAVGGDPRLFAPDAYRIIAQMTGGIPRSINVLCDTALVYGYSASAPMITGDVLHAVINDKRKFGVFRFGGAPS